MKIFCSLIIFCASFKICIAQVDSLLIENKSNIFYDSFNEKSTQKYDEQFQFYDPGYFNNSIQFQKEFNLSLQQFSFLTKNQYSYFENKINTAPNDNYLSYLKEIIPKDNPVFSIKYALFYGLYSDNHKLLKRWNCIP